MVSTSSNGRRSVGSLVSELANGGSRLVRQELRLARLELAELARGVGVGTALVATGAVLALIGTMTLITGVIMLIAGAWMGEQYWLVALVAALVLMVGAAFLAWRGAKLLEPSRLAPDESLEVVRENREWAKRQLTSAGTSN